MELSGNLIKGTGSYVVKEVAPPVTSGQRVNNSKFTTWVADNPSNWTVLGEDANNYFTENPGGGCRVLSNAATLYMYQAVAVIGRSYKITVKCSSWTSGKLRIYFNSLDVIVDGVGTFSNVVKPLGTTLYFQHYVATADMVIDSIEVEEVPEGYPLMDKGTKYLECTSVGTVAFPSDQAYGEWEFDWYKEETNSSYFSFIGLTPYSVTNGYSLSSYIFRVLSDERLSFAEGNTDGSYKSNLILTAITPVINTWYRIKITRTLDGEFTIYIKGGEFGADDWVLLDVSGGSGTNPTVENTYQESRYFVVDLDIGGRVANIITRKAVQQ